MDNPTRRVFLARSVIASVSGAHLLTARLSATDLVLQEGSGRNLFDRMKWFNDPASAKVDGEQLIVVTRAKTDYWRKTYYGYITNNGHFYHMPFDGDFILQARRHWTRERGCHTRLFGLVDRARRLHERSSLVESCAQIRCTGDVLFDRRQELHINTSRIFADACFCAGRINVCITRRTGFRMQI